MLLKHFVFLSLCKYVLETFLLCILFNMGHIYFPDPSKECFIWRRGRGVVVFAIITFYSTFAIFLENRFVFVGLLVWHWMVPPAEWL